MTKELWIALLTFVAAALTLATQMLPVPPNVLPYLLYAVAVINAGLTVFFGYTGIKTRQANRQVKAGH